MYGIVLGTGPQFAVLVLTGCSCQRITLKSTHHGITHDTGQIGVLTVGLLSPAPSWVTEDIDIRCPYRQRTHLHILATKVIDTMVILRTELRRGHIKALIQQGGVKRRCHRHRFWEIGDITHIGSTMQGFAPPKELLDAQAGNSWTLVKHQHGLFL